MEGSEPAALLARQIGEREILHEEIGISMGQDDRRYNVHPVRRTEAVVMAAEIQRLPRLEGYLCIAGMDRSKVRIKPCPPQRRQRGFIPRALRQPVAMTDNGLRPLPPNGASPSNPVRTQD